MAFLTAVVTTLVTTFGNFRQLNAAAQIHRNVERRAHRRYFSERLVALRFAHQQGTAGPVPTRRTRSALGEVAALTTATALPTRGALSLARGARALRTLRRTCGRTLRIALTLGRLLTLSCALSNLSDVSDVDAIARVTGIATVAALTATALAFATRLRFAALTRATTAVAGIARLTCIT